jgi:hypothetical protein
MGIEAVKLESAIPVDRLRFLTLGPNLSSV